MNHYRHHSSYQQQVQENQNINQQKQENNLTSGHFQQQHKQNEQISEVEQNQGKHKQHSDQIQSSFHTKYNIKLVLESQIIEKYQDKLQKNDIVYMTSQDQMQKINKNQMKIQNCYKFSHQHKIVQLKFQIGNFLLSLTILNLEAANQNSFFHQKNNVKASSKNFEKASKLNSGGFGDLYLGQTLQGQQFVTKCIKFSKLQNFKLDKNHKKRIDEHNKEFLFIVLKQFSITKIASVLSFGPKVLSPFGFDILFTSQCAQFFLEKCLDHKEIQYNQQLEKDLIENFRLMHSIKLMHRDIKPNNILYSKTRQKHIFCDFGISHFVNENVDQQTLTMFSGTWKYISSDMKKLQKEGEINLYDNDFYGLRKSLEDFPIQKKEESKDSGNSESVEDSENWSAFLKQKMVLMRLIFNVSKNIFKSLKNLNSLDVVKKNKRQVFELFISSQYREATEEYCKQFISEKIFSLEEGHQIQKKSYKNFAGFCINDKKSEKYSSQEFNLRLALKNIQTLKIKSDLAIINASKSTLSPKKILTNLQSIRKYSTQRLQDYFQIFFRFIKFTQITYNASLDQKLQACSFFQQVLQEKQQKIEKTYLKNALIQTYLSEQAMLQPKLFPIFNCLLNLFEYCFSSQSSKYFCLLYLSQLFFQLTFLSKFCLQFRNIDLLFEVIFNHLQNDMMKFLDQCLKITLNLFVISYKFGSVTKVEAICVYFWRLIIKKYKEKITYQNQQNHQNKAQATVQQNYQKKIKLFKLVIKQIMGQDYQIIQKINNDYSYTQQINIQKILDDFKQLNLEKRHPNIIRFFKIKAFELMDQKVNYQHKMQFINNNLQNTNQIINIQNFSIIRLQYNRGNIENAKCYLEFIDQKVNCQTVFHYFFLNIRLFFFNRNFQLRLCDKSLSKQLKEKYKEQKSKQYQNQRFLRICQIIQIQILTKNLKNLKEICKYFIAYQINTIYNFCFNKKDFQVQLKTNLVLQEAQIIKRFCLLPQKALKQIQSLSNQQYLNLELDFQTFFRIFSYVIQTKSEDDLSENYLNQLEKLQENQINLQKYTKKQFSLQNTSTNSLRIIFLKSLYYLRKKQYKLSSQQAQKIRQFDMKKAKGKKTFQIYCNCLRNYIQSAIFLLFNERQKKNCQQTNIIFDIVLEFYQKIQKEQLIQYCFNSSLAQSFLRIFIKKQDVQKTYSFLFFLTAYSTKQSEQLNFDRIIEWIQFLNKQIESKNISLSFSINFINICKAHLDSFQISQNKYIFVIYLIFFRHTFNPKVIQNNKKYFQQQFRALISRIKRSFQLGICQDIQRRTIKAYYSSIYQFYKQFSYFPDVYINKNSLLSIQIQKQKRKLFYVNFKTKTQGSLTRIKQQNKSKILFQQQFKNSFYCYNSSCN